MNWNRELHSSNRNGWDVAKGDNNKRPRRDHGDGSLYFRESDGRWVGSFYHEGQRKYVYGSVGGKKAEASRKLKEAMQKAEQGTLVASNKQTMAEYLTYWLSVKKLPHKPNTDATQTSMTRAHLIPHFGKLQLQKVARHHVQQFVKDLLEEDGLKPSTIHTIFGILHTALDDAVSWQLLALNPCEHVTLPRRNERDYIALSREQVQAFQQSLQGSSIEVLITLAIATGMRRGELLALKWSDIDLARGKLRVQRSVSRITGEGYKEVTPKTKASKRTISLTASMCEALKEHRHKQKEMRVKAAEWNDLDLVFPSERGNHMRFASLFNRFKRELQKAGLPKEMRFHDLRHTCATLMLGMGISPKIVSEVLGHSSITITMNLYGHVIPGMQELAMERYGEYLKSEGL